MSSFKICPHVLLQNLLLQTKLEVVAKRMVSSTVLRQPASYGY